MEYTRREILKIFGLGGVCLATVPLLFSYEQSGKMRTRMIPSSGEPLPIVGLGTWQTFDVGRDQGALEVRKQVLLAMKKSGGRVIDSSPMYGSSEEVVGDLTSILGIRKDFFYATKVWTSGKEAGIAQMNSSFHKMRRTSMDLMQIHNLVDWKIHVKTLREWKEQGKIRYWGITHYIDSAHGTLEKIIAAEHPDFVQFNYSIRSLNAERSLFDTCGKNKTAVIINQPFESGSLFRTVKGKPLPDWCEAYDINSWAQYFLKFILSNEAVTCVIPGTSKPQHMADNMMAGYGNLPDAGGREKMLHYLKSL
ncbi:MAG TPA: aldo/keto reductase [Eudoraea sp.]|nr:aldo/keto reductase [Eudoraea sp.]